VALYQVTITICLQRRSSLVEKLRMMRELLPAADLCHAAVGPRRKAMRPCIKLLYPLVCLQEQRRSSLEEKLRVMQASRDELQTYATQQSGLVGDLQGRNSQLTIDNDALRRRLADLQQVT